MVDKFSAYLRIKRLHLTAQFRILYAFGNSLVQRLEKGQVFVIDPIPVGRVYVPEPVRVVHPVPENLEHLRRRPRKLKLVGVRQFGGVLAAGGAAANESSNANMYIRFIIVYLSVLPKMMLHPTCTTNVVL